MKIISDLRMVCPTLVNDVSLCLRTLIRSNQYAGGRYIILYHLSSYV